MITVSTEGGGNVFDSFSEWIDLIEKLGGHVCTISTCYSNYLTRAKSDPWTEEEVKAFEDEIMEDYGLVEFEEDTYVTGRK